MSRILMTSWGEHALAARNTLSTGCQSIDIFERNPLRIDLDQAEVLTALKYLLATVDRARIRIAVSEFDPLRQRFPRFMTFFERWSHRIEIRRLPDRLANLPDAMVLADGCHATVRFQYDQPRAVTIIDDLDATAPFQARFEALWAECSEIMGSRTLGL